jgi:hypothetical protein
MFSPTQRFLALNAIDFPKASSRTVEHYHGIRRGDRQIAV